MDKKIIEEAREIVEEIIVKYMEFEAKVSADMSEIEGEDRKLVSIIVEGDDLGILIGSRGINLDAFQNIVSMFLRNKVEEPVSVIFDINGYRERKRKSLEDIACKAAQETIENGVEVSLNPMSPAERRIVHLALENDERVATESQGDGINRYVIVKPVEK